MKRAILVLCAGLVAVFSSLLSVAPPRVDAGTARWSQVSVTSAGIKLTLSLRHRAYPRNALVRMWARMQNLTAHTIWVYDNGPMAAGKYIPQPVVLAAPGGDPLAISLPAYFPFPGPLPFAFPLRAGAVRNIPEIIILRGPFVQLDLTLARGTQTIAYPGRTLSTPLLRVRLVAPDTPIVHLNVPPAQVTADITPPSGIHGRPLAVWYYVCSDTSAPAPIQEKIDWTPVDTHLAPTCGPLFSLLGWHQIAGWLNHSVAEIDWGQR